jgi:hypothetical protein
MSLLLTVYKDTKTKSPFIEDYTDLGDDGEAAATAKPDHIYMDCMGFGMGCSCLQVTFQACNITEARLLYDQLSPLCPIMVCARKCWPSFDLTLNLICFSYFNVLLENSCYEHESDISNQSDNHLYSYPIKISDL